MNPYLSPVICFFYLERESKNLDELRETNHYSIVVPELGLHLTPWIWFTSLVHEPVTNDTRKDSYS